MLPRRYDYVVALSWTWSSGFLRFLRNARVTRGYDFRSRQKRPVPLARCVSRYVRRKRRRVRASARICAPCDNRTFRNDAFSACTFRYFPRSCRRCDDAPPAYRERLVSISPMNNSTELESQIGIVSHLPHWTHIYYCYIEFGRMRSLMLNPS